MERDLNKIWINLGSYDEQGGVYKLNYDITQTINSHYNNVSNMDYSYLLWEFSNEEITIQDDKKEKNMEIDSKINDYADILKKSKNIILHGAPGTGKTYLANQIAASIVSNGKKDSLDDLSEQEKQRIDFVQFHPSYDYTDFVEGLRPLTRDNQISFELKNGIFKDFCERAQKNNKEESYIFIIDEINRGEISKILGELFFALDPGYRGISGSITTQYSNMKEGEQSKFYIPENVYIIGTMNDIDRSVDSFDFAMRRRFRFMEIKPEDSLEMLNMLNEDTKESAIQKMHSLNQAISEVEELNANYHIGPAYFLKLQEESIDELWSDYLYPLLSEYVRGFYNEKELLNSFYNAYYSSVPMMDDSDEVTTKN